MASKTPRGSVGCLRREYFGQEEVRPQEVDEGGGGAVLALGPKLSFQHRLQCQREFLAQFHPPLVVRIDAQDHALDKHPMLVERDDLAQGEGRQLFIGQHG